MNTHVSRHGLARSALDSIAAALLLLLFGVAAVFAQTGPTIVALSPNSTTAGGPGFTITLAGSNFTGSSVVRWNGIDRTTAFVSASELRADIRASDIAAPGTANVTVFNPVGSPNAGTSNAFPFTINAPSNPAPIITALSPASAEAGGPAFTLTITGTNYLASSIVRWNGTSRPTTFLSPTQLAAAISLFDIASPGSASVTVFNPAPGGGVSNAAQFTISPPTVVSPMITNLIPNAAQAAGPGFTLTVTGINFTPSSVVRWNGSNRATGFGSSNQLTAQISATDIAAPGVATITVFNQGPGGGVSNGMPFTISPPPNLTPTITSISPQSAVAGSPAFTLLVSGSNFVNASVVRWNGAARPTTLVSANQLAAAIPAADISQPGMATVTVSNSGAGGGTSNALGFTITPPVNPVPVIVSLAPDSAEVGERRFRLTVVGSGFVAQSVVQWNNADRPTTFVTASQLVATILASDLERAGVAFVAVVNPGPGGGRSGALPFTISSAPVSSPHPILAAIASTVVTQGAANVALTLIGDRFKPGARVIVSDASTGALDAAKEILVQRSTVINGTTMTAIISISSSATPGIRKVDVVNSDGSNTGPAGSRTSQQLRIEEASSLGAPFTVRSLVITYPRDATAVGAGEEVLAEAIIGGAGTGTISGQWLWDGNAVEQFSVNLNGGEPARVKSTRSLPTTYLGSHRLELRIVAPNMLNSHPIQIVVNPGAWRLLRLLAPRFGAGFTADAPPLLRWAIVPDAAKYQVGFSKQPKVDGINNWYEVEDTRWQVSEKVWELLPEGMLYWTVRVVGPGGELRKPAPMRRIYRLRKGALQPSLQPGRNANGYATVEWEGLNLQEVYRIVVSRDPEGKEIVRRLMTRQPRIELRDFSDVSDSTEIYYWSVEAISPAGHSIMTRAPRSLVAGRFEYRSQQSSSPARKPTRVGSLNNATVNALRRSCCYNAPDSLLSSAGLRVALSSPDLENEVTLQIAGRDALPDLIVRESRPSIRLESKTTPIPADIAILVDDVDVTALARVEGRALTFTPAIPLAAGAHRLAVHIGGRALNWKFVVSPGSADQSASAESPGNDAEKVDSPGSTPSSGSSVNIDAAANTQWTSGSEGDSNVITVGAQMSYTRGAWRVEMNGGGLLNNLLGPKPRNMLGRFNDYVFRVAHERKDWGETLRLGTISPEIYLGAEFMTVAVPRHSVEAGLRTPIGKLAFYTNVTDVSPVEVQGFSLPDTIQGASFEPRLPNERIKFRLMWLGARDRDARSSIPTFGFPASTLLNPSDSLGGLLTVMLGKAWSWTSEYVAVAIEGVQPSHALRTGLAGALGTTTLTVAFRDVAKNYSSPGNLSPFGIADRRGLDAALVRATSFGALSFAYQFLQSDARSQDRPTTSLHTATWNWSKSVTKTTSLSLGGNVARTYSGEPRTENTSIGSSEVPLFLVPATDQSRIGITATATRSLGQLMLTLGGSRNWSRDEINPGQNSINSMINLNGAWTARTFFQLQSNISVNWLAGDRLTVGQTRTLTAYLQPTLAWNRTGLQAMPLLTLSTTAGILGNGTRMVDMLMTQYGGRVAWRMPGRLQFSTLSFESNYSRIQDRLFGSTITTPRLLLVWTIVKPSRASGG